MESDAVGIEMVPLLKGATPEGYPMASVGVAVNLQELVSMCETMAFETKGNS